MWKIFKKLMMGFIWMIVTFIAIVTIACAGLVMYEKWLDYKYSKENKLSEGEDTEPDAPEPT